MSLADRSGAPDDEKGDVRRDLARHAPRMASPARADRVTVEGLLQWAREGRLRLPAFQRALRWTDEDRRALLDSMERGYPIGTLLLWRRTASGQQIGAPLPNAPPIPESGDVHFIVDGQQRVNALWEALATEPRVGERAAFFDLQSEGFAIRPLRRGDLDPPVANNEASPPQLPLHLALDATTLSEWVPHALPREMKRRYFEVGKRLREYPIPIYVVEGDDIEVLRIVFDRINSTGKPLSREEVFEALVGSRIGAGEDAGLGLVLSQLRSLDFGQVDRSTILKVFEVVSGERIGKADPRRLDPSVAEKSLLSAARALSDAVVFLRHIGVPHVELLPYELPLIVLARLFSLHNSPAEKSLVLLRRWFWRGAIGARLAGSSGSLQQHVDDVQPDDEHGSVQRLLRRTGAPERPDLHALVAEEVSVATARGKILLCALFSHAPRSLVTGEKLSPIDLFEAGAGELLSRIAPPNTSPLAKSIANRLLHPKSGRAPLRLICDAMDEGALASHAIDRVSHEALRGGDVAAFLTRRSEVLADWITAFLDRHAEWDRSDTPPVSALAKRRVAS